MDILYVHFDEELPERKFWFPDMKKNRELYCKLHTVHYGRKKERKKGMPVKANRKGRLPIEDISCGSLRFIDNHEEELETFVGSCRWVHKCNGPLLKKQSQN